MMAYENTLPASKNNKSRAKLFFLEPLFRSIKLLLLSFILKHNCTVVGLFNSTRVFTVSLTVTVNPSLVWLCGYCC